PPHTHTLTLHDALPICPRGGLTPAAGGDASLLQELQYEQDVELPGSNIAPFFNQRRIDNLEPLTPHEMPVPAKQLNTLQLPLYTDRKSTRLNSSHGSIS